MSFKKLIGLTTGLVMALVVAAPAQAQQHRATRLGNPATRFAKPLKKADDLRVLLRAEKMKADVAAILQQVGWKGNLEDLDRGAATADIEDIEIPTGTRMPYMAARKKGEPVALMDVEWAGKKPFEAFAFEFSSNCQRYRLVTPKKCSNFWIEALGEDTSKACMPLDPVVGIAAGEKQVCVTQPVQFRVDVENYAADGPVALSVNGEELVSGNLSAGSYTWTFPGAKTPGTYEIKAVAGDFSAATKVEVVACAPTCGLTASPQPVKAGKPFTLDVSGSQVAPGVTGGIASVQVEVLREGEVVDTVNMTAPNFVNNAFVIEKGGPHTVRAVVTDEAGQTSTNVCQADLDVQGGPPIFFGGYFGKERLVHDHPIATPSDASIGIPATICAPHMGIAAGFQPKIGENAEAELAVGYKINFQDGAHSSMYADAAANYLLGGGFIGGGLTFWDIFEDDTRFVGLLLQAGFDLSDDGKWQLVGQARAPFDEFGDIDNNYQLWGGIRFRPNSWK